jgi:hypothetical protein
VNPASEAFSPFECLAYVDIIRRISPPWPLLAPWDSPQIAPKELPNNFPQYFQAPEKDYKPPFGQSYLCESITSSRKMKEPKCQTKRQHLIPHQRSPIRY